MSDPALGKERAAPAVVYALDARPPAREAIPLGAQHVVTMLLGNITPPLLVAGALGLSGADTAFLIRAVFFMAGVATLVQAYPIGPVGGRIPIVMGTSVTFVAATIGIGRTHGLAGIFGACFAAAVVEVALGFGIAGMRRLFPPLVTGTVVMLIGLTLIPVGIDYAAGGPGAADYGAPIHLGIAAAVFLVTLLLNRLVRGFWSYASVLAGALVGYALAWAVGRVEVTPVAEAAWVAVPVPLELGLAFHWDAIVLIGLVYVVSAMETIGDISGVIAAGGREPTMRELRGGLVADGVMSGVAALFGALPNTSYSQNVGLVNFTGVMSRHVTAVAGAMLVVLGIVPKVGAFLATLPPPVIGGGGLIMFAMIFASGLTIVQRGVTFTRRNLVILAAAIGLGLGVELRPEAVAQVPDGLRTLAGSGLIVGGLVAVLLNALLPERDARVDSSRRPREIT